MAPSPRPASLLLVALSTLALAACREDQSSVEVDFLDPVVELSMDESGRVRLDGTVKVSATVASWNTTGGTETEIWLDKLDVTAPLDPLRPLAADMRVPDGSSFFPLAVDPVLGGSVRVPFTGASFRTPGDELAWLCSIGQPMEVKGSVYDAASGTVQPFYHSFGVVHGSTEIQFSRKDPATRPFAPRRVSTFPQFPGSFLPLLEVRRAWGGFVLGGEVFDALDFNNQFIQGDGVGNAFLVHFNEQGAAVWAKGFGDQGEDGISSLASRDGGDLFVAGLFTSSIDLGAGAHVVELGGSTGYFVARMAEGGSAAWSVGFVEELPFTIEGCPPRNPRIAARVDGGVSLVKSLHGTVDLGSGPITGTPSADVYCGVDLLVAAYDDAGALLHASRYGDDLDQQALDVVVDAAGNTWVVGFTEGTLDFGQGLAPIVGPGLLLPPEARLFVAAFDPQGTPIVARDLGLIRQRFGYRVHLAARPGGGVVVAGPFIGRIEAGAQTITSTGTGEDGFVVALDAAGAPLWAHHFDHAGGTFVEAFTLADVSVADDGRVFLLGRATSTFSVDGGQLPGGDSTFGGGGAGALFTFALDGDGVPRGYRILACNVGLSSMDLVGDEVTLGASVLGHAEGEGGRFLRNDGALWFGRLPLDP